MTNKVEEYKAESVIVVRNQLGFLQPKPPPFLSKRVFNRVTNQTQKILFIYISGLK